MRRIVLALLALFGAGLGYLAYLGYFGGTLFIPVAPDPQAAARRPAMAAVVLSGDMGFNAGMAPRTAKRLAADGISVIGVNSLVYFRKQRSPHEVEQLLAEAMRRAMAYGHTDHVVLIGQSFGADMIPVGLSQMPAALRDKITMVGLIVPTDTLFLRASPSELFNWAAPDADALVTARQLNWLPVTCISGREETTSLCPHMTSANLRQVSLPGDHYLDHDADGLHRVLLEAIDRAAALPPRITKSSAS